MTNRYQSNQNYPQVGEKVLASIQSSANPQVLATSGIGAGPLARCVGPLAVASSQAVAIICSNSKSLPNIPTAIGRHLSGSKVRFLLK